MTENLESKSRDTCEKITFLDSPTQDDLRPTPALKHYALSILVWQELSAKPERVLGEPEYRD